MTARMLRVLLFMIVSGLLVVSAWQLESVAYQSSQALKKEPNWKMANGVGMAARALRFAGADPELGKQVGQGVGTGEPDQPKPQKDDAASPEAPDETKPLKEQIIEIQNKGKLGYRRVVLCSAVEGFGMYSPVVAGQVPPRVIIYVEPSNVSTLVNDDRYVIDLSVDLFVIGEAGVPLFAKQNLPIRKVSRSPFLDLHYAIGVDLKKYLKHSLITIRTVLHDKIKNQSISRSIKIRLQARDKKPQEI